MATVVFSPVGNGFQWFGQTGLVLAGGKINTYAAGSTTRQATYTDNTGTVANANPIILDSTGRYAQEIWLDVTLIPYKFVITDALGVVQFTLDNIPSTTTGAVNISYTPPGAGAVATNVNVELNNFQIPNISSLRAIAKGTSSIVFVGGSSSLGDGGGAFYYYVSSDTTSADNGVTIIVGNDGGRWYLALNDAHLPTRLPVFTATFTGSGLSANMWQNITGTASSTTAAEVGFQSTLTSTAGFANASTAFKIGMSSSVLGNASSANVYGANFITQGFAGAGGYLVTGVESDINNIGADSGILGSTTASYGFVAVAAGGHQSTAGLWITSPGSGARWLWGVAVQGPLGNYAYVDDSSGGLGSFLGYNGIMVGTLLKPRQSMIHGYVAQTTFQIVARLENDNGGSGAVALGLSATSSATETRVAKAGISLTRAGGQGIGVLDICNRTNNDTNDFTAADSVLSWDSANIMKFPAASEFATNGAVATVLGSVGPTGASTTVVKWLTFKDNGGAVRYVPCF